MQLLESAIRLRRDATDVAHLWSHRIASRRRGRFDPVRRSLNQLGDLHEQTSLLPRPAVRTSSATTANPSPCSYRAGASMAALSASRCVCRAIRAIVWANTPIRSGHSGQPGDGRRESPAPLHRRRAASRSPRDASRPLQRRRRAVTHRPASTRAHPQGFRLVGGLGAFAAGVIGESAADAEIAGEPLRRLREGFRVACNCSACRRELFGERRDLIGFSLHEEIVAAISSSIR